MTDEERAFLVDVISAHSGRIRTMIPVFVHWSLTWVFLFVLLVLAWSGIAWLAGATLDVGIGWSNGTAALWVLAGAAIATLVLSVASTARWKRDRDALHQPIHEDLARGRVRTEEYEFREAIRMQEPEHFGLIYFLRERDDSAFVFFDRESQELGARGRDPLSGSLVPRKHLQIVRAPESRLIISSRFSGDALGSGDPLRLAVPPEDWPEHGEIADEDWNQLPVKYAGRNHRAPDK